MSDNNSTETSNEELKNVLAEHSFKVKPIFLELPNYTYYHSAMDRKDEDPNKRFIGRKKIIDKLRSFIYESKTNTGTYLVSGFRGMGKTSVVNEALSILKPKSKVLKYVQLWLLLLLLLLIPKEFYDLLNESYILKIGVIAVFIFLWLLFFAVYIKRSTYYSKENYWSFFKRSFRTLKELDKTKFAFLNILYKLLLFLSITYFVLLLWSVLDLNLPDKFWFLFGFILCLYLETRIINTVFSYQLKQKNRQIHLVLMIFGLAMFMIIRFVNQSLFYAFFCLIIALIIHLSCLLSIVQKNSNQNYFSSISILKSYFDLKQHLIIKINLGKDNLVEKDVLKFIVNELHYEYKRWYTNYKNEKRFVNLLFLSLSLLGIIKIGFNILPEKIIQDEINETFGISDFFPSQELLSLHHKDTINYNNLSSLQDYTDILAFYNSKFLFKNDIVQVSLVKEDSLYKKLNNKKIELCHSQGNINRELVDLSLKVDSLKERNKHIQDSIYLEDKLKTISNRLRIINEHKVKIQKEKAQKIDQKEFLVSLKKNKLLRDHFIEYGYTNFNPNEKGLEKFNFYLARILNGLDFAIISYWTKIRRGIIPEKYLDKKKSQEGESRWIKNLLNFLYPPIPNYIVFFCFVLLLVIFRFLPSRFKPFTSHTCIIKDLDKLKEEINYSIQIDKNAGAFSGRNSIINFGKSKRKDPLDSKDITQRLIHLLAKVDSIRSIFIRVKLIFIFDELDKIEANHNESLSSKENEYETKDKNARYNTRRRERIGNILSGMKHFLNSAKAKFIFIAGREMYDASLAGISDRESSLDSIFNDNKIYVESFYLEGHDGKLSDITSMTETYICQFLIPPEFLDDYNNNTQEEDTVKQGPSLKMYNEFLKSKGVVKNVQNETLKEKKEREKIIITLKDFIVYLTYRSNGAPRKLSNLFEQHIEKFDKSALFGKSCNTKIVKGNNDNSLYLKLSYYDQYKVSVISYLLTPIIYQLGNHIHEYSDKLLVSISYMLDHIFKHHKYGLSFRSLALTPEIVDVNKEPEFRNFLERFINTMSASHLRPIVSGIYDYKFHSKVTTEFTFLSKINEQETAAFNFTQDETIELKRHFNKRLDLFREQNKTGYLKKDVYEDYVNSEAFLLMMIGDLHYNDSQFSDAILNYMNALHTIRRQSISKMYVYDFVLMVRNKLKLGLAFEKNKMSDNAFMTYSELSDLILRKRNISLKELGLVRFILKNKKEIKSLNVNKEKRVLLLTKLKEASFNEIIIIGRPKSNLKISKTLDWQKLYHIDDMESYYSDSERDLISDFENIDINYKSTKWNYIFSTLENIRLLYQPIIAKLHLIEKVGPSKLGKQDLLNAIEEFDYLRAPLDIDNKTIITAEFYNKLGDLMFFRNGSLLDYFKVEALSKEVMPIDALIFYLFAYKSLQPLGNQINKYLEVNSFFELKDGDVCSSFVNAAIGNIDMLEINTEYKLNNSYGEMNSLANILVDIAGSLLCFIDSEILGVLGSKVDENKQKIKTFGIVIKVISIYSKAAQLYSLMGEHRLAKSQYIKIFHLIRENYSNEIVKNVVDCIVEVDDFEDLLNKSIALCYKVNGQANHIELHKIEEIYESDELNSLKTEYATTLKGDIDELLYLYWMIKLKEAKTEFKLLEVREFVYENTTPYSVPRKKHNRILELILRLSLNNKLYNGVDFYLDKSYSYYLSIISKSTNLNMKLGFIKRKCLVYVDPKISKRTYSYDPSILIEPVCLKINSEEFLERKKFLIIDSLGVCNELLKLHDLLGVNYVTTNHRVLASCHYKMYEWNSRWINLIQDLDKKTKNDLEVILKSTLNSETLMYMNKKQSLGLSNSYSDKVIDFHTRGKTLYSFLQNCSYLDDFYNDSMVHFSIALERSYLIKDYKRLSRLPKDRASDNNTDKDLIEKDLNIDFKNYYK